MHALRIHCTGRPGAALKPITGACPASAWDADDLTIAVWLDAGTMTSGVPDAFDITTVATLRLECRADVDTEAMLFDAKEVTSLTACTYAAFKDGTGEHAEFVMTAANMNVGSAVSSVWVSITAVLDDDTRHTFAAGELKIEHSGDSDALGAVADAVTPYTQLAFKTIAVAGQSDIVADTRDDTLTIVAGSNITLTTSGDTLTITSAGGGGGGGSGDVVGPSSAVNNRVVFFDGTTGKLIKDSGITLSGNNTGDQTSISGITGTTAQFNTALSDGDFATLAGSEALTNKTVNGLTVTTSTGTLTIASGKTLTASNTLTLAGTDASTLNIGTGGTLGTAAFTAATAYAQVANNLSDLASASTARTNLGLGTLATLSTVTLTSNVTGTLPVANGGTGITALGTALQVLRTNAGATALEFATLAGGGNAQTADPLSQFAATTSAQLRGVISDETGTGALVFAGGNIGAATATSLAATGNITTSGGGFYSGTANTANGSLTLYGDSVAGSISILSTVATMAREWDFPDADGTFASQEWIGQWTGSSNITTIGTIASPVFTGSIGIPAGTVTVPGLAFTDDADGSGTGIYRSAANELSIASNGVQTFKVAATGITTVTNATAATSSTTGGLVVTGGIGAGQNCNFGQNLTVQIGTYSPIFGAVSGGVVKLTGSTAGADCTRVSFQFTPSTAGSALTISGTTLSTALGTGVAGGTFATTGGRVITSSIKTTTYTVTANDDYLVANSGTPFTITLIAASANTGRRFIFSNKGAGTLTIDATGLGQITRGSAANTTSLTTGQSVELVSDGATWVGPAAPAGSGDLLAANNLSDVASTATALTNLTGTVAANLVFAGPNTGGADNPSFRALEVSDIPAAMATQAFVTGTFTGSTNLATLGTVVTGTWNATAVGVAYGGTGLTSLTANNVILGNGTSTPSFVAPGTSGNVLTSNGTTWQSSAPAGGSSPTTTRGDLIRRGASADERLAIGAAGSRLTSDGTDALWYRPSKFAEWYDDFLGNSLTSPANAIGWEAGGTGSFSFTSESGRPGIVVMSTGAGTTGFVRVNSAVTSIRLGGGVFYWEASVKISALSDVTDEYDLRLGLGDSTGAAHADGVYFEYDRNSSTDWRCVTAKASSRTESTGETPTAVAAGSWIKLAFEVNAAASEVKFYINGTLVRTDSGANIPNTDSNLCGFYNHIVKSAGTTARTCSVDYIYSYHLLTTER